jgi:hypothetical protein
VCIDFFIQAAGRFGLSGDNRGFSSNSDPEQSRAFINVDVKNKRFDYQVNPSCTTGGSCNDPVSSNSVNVTFGDDGSFTVSAHLTNSEASVLGEPSIRANVKFTPDGNGGYDAHGTRTAFPSFGAYYYNNGNVQTIIQRPEAGGALGPLRLLTPQVSF